MANPAQVAIVVAAVDAAAEAVRRLSMTLNEVEDAEDLASLVDASDGLAQVRDCVNDLLFEDDEEDEADDEEEESSEEEEEEEGEGDDESDHDEQDDEDLTEEDEGL